MFKNVKVEIINSFSVFNIKGSTSLFFGANVVLPQTKDLSAEINKCSTAIQQFTPNLCTLVKTTLKTNRPEFQDAGNALTDIQYLFEDIQSFYGSFLSCLNEQNETSTAKSVISELNNLIYQLDVYIITVIDGKLASSVDAIGTVFGDKVKDVIIKIAAHFSEEFGSIKTSLGTLVTNFQAIVDSGGEISATTIATDFDLTPLNEMITAFKNIYDTSLQINVVMKGFVTIINVLDKATTAVKVTESVSKEMVKKSSYEMDTSIQAARSMFSKNVLQSTQLVTDAFSAFFTLSSTIFPGDVDIQMSRAIVDTFMLAINDALESTSDAMINTFSQELTALTTEITALKQTVSDSTAQVTDFLATSVKTNSASFITCLAVNSTNSKLSLALVASLGVDSSKCISAQSNVSLDASSLMTFIVEDVVLNVGGIANKLCGCSVNGGIKAVEKSKMCIDAITADMGGDLLTVEQDYLTTETENIKTKISDQVEVFKTCSAEVKTSFDAKFETFMNSVNACLSV